MKEPIINDYESYRNKIHILNPDTGEFVPVAEWEKDSDPTRAEIIAIDTPYYRLAFYKKFLGAEMFEDAQKKAEGFTLAGFPHAFRSPRRNESTYIYDARFYGLDEAMKLIGGDRLDVRWWTCEKDADPRYYANYAWYFHGGRGFAYSGNYCSAYQVLASVLLTLPEAE